MVFGDDSDRMQRHDGDSEWMTRRACAGGGRR